MFIVNNKTPYTADAVLLPDDTGKLSVVSVIKAGFSFSAQGQIKASESPPPLCYGDEYWGEPGLSSLRYASDLVYGKHGTDIVVNGHAHAPMGRPVKSLRVAVMVGTHLKTLRVKGDRYLSERMGVFVKTRTLPFLKMPLLYERAFGGMDTSHRNLKKHKFFDPNPVGTGFRLRQRKGSTKNRPLPNFEHGDKPVKQGNAPMSPAGFGCIAPNWEPRRAYAGTYDEAWMAERMPLPPKDINIRFNNAASPYLITDTPLSGKESVTLFNLHPSAETIHFKLPGLTLKAAYVFEKETVWQKTVFDTLVIEPDENRFNLVYRTRYTGKRDWSELIQVTMHEDT